MAVHDRPLLGAKSVATLLLQHAFASVSDEVVCLNGGLVVRMSNSSGGSRYRSVHQAVSGFRHQGLHSHPHCSQGVQHPITWICVEATASHLGVLPGHECLHEDTVHDLQLVNVTALQLLKAVLLQVAGAALTRKAAGAAVEVEVVVLAHMAVHGRSVQSACDVLADAQAVLQDELVLLAWHPTPKPV